MLTAIAFPISGAVVSPRKLLPIASFGISSLRVECGKPVLR